MDQPLNVLVGVAIWIPPTKMIWQELLRGNFRASIVRTHISGEPAYDTQTTAALRRFNVRPRSPPNGQFCSDNAGALLFNEMNEIAQQKFRFFKFVSQLAAKLQIIGQVLVQVFHWAPPIHGRASGRKAPKST